MYCKHCGKEIDDNSSFCKYCGKKLVEIQKITIDIKKPQILDKASDKVKSIWDFIYNLFCRIISELKSRFRYFLKKIKETNFSDIFYIVFGFVVITFAITYFAVLIIFPLASLLFKIELDDKYILVWWIVIAVIALFPFFWWLTNDHSEDNNESNSQNLITIMLHS